MSDYDFNSDQLDMLRELMNIAVGNATASIADLLQAFGKMHIPQIAVSDINGLDQHLKNTIEMDQPHYVTKQLFGGLFSGEFLFVIPEVSARNLGLHLYDVEEPTQADTIDAIVELTNILSATMISRLSEELNTKVQFFVPSTELVHGSRMISEDELMNYRKIIIISTQMDFSDQNIEGYILILTKDDMIFNLKLLIDRKLEELFS